MVSDVATRAAPVARVERGDLVESVHLGHVVVLGPDGSVRHAVGDPDVVVWPRSSLKPVQAVAMLRHGLDADGADLALVCASHSGEPGHLDVVRGLLARAGLTEADLRNTADWPVTVDGCGAPLLSTTLAGLARAFGTLASAVDAGPPAAARVARAMSGHPWHVGGRGVTSPPS